jgi:hypothetical protein
LSEVIAAQAIFLGSEVDLSLRDLPQFLAEACVSFNIRKEEPLRGLKSGEGPASFGFINRGESSRPKVRPWLGSRPSRIDGGVECIGLSVRNERDHGNLLDYTFMVGRFRGLTK